MRGGDTTNPSVQFPIALDDLVIGARALPLEYAGTNAEQLEDGAREWLGTGFLTLARRHDPSLVPLVERVIGLGRRGDANADKAVEEGTASLIDDAERSRSLGRELLGVVRRSFTVVVPMKTKAKTPTVTAVGAP